MGVNGANKSGPRRSYYPSGLWIDGIRPYESSAPERKERKKKRLPGNPDLSNYQIVKAKETPGFLIVMIQYPDCTNFEGKKILVFKDITLVDLVNQKLIDPHFFPDQLNFKSPVARFVPTDQGWEMAIALTQMAK